MSRSFTRKQRPDAPVTAPAEDVEQDRPAEPETAESRKAEADQARAEAERSRTEAARLLEQADAEAVRITSEARQRANELSARALAADRFAEEAAERAGYLAYALGLRANMRAAEDLAATLTAEADKLTARVADLDVRLAEAASRSEDTTAALATALEAGDFAGVRDSRAELAAVDEVAGVLTGQRQRAVERLTAIGTADGTGELSGAHGAVQTARANLSDTLDRLDPERIETRREAVMASFMEQTGGDAPTAALLTLAALDPELVTNVYGSPSPDHQKRG